MNAARLRTTVRSLRGTALASLRIVGLMYTSLAGILALALVIAVALLPVSPGFQEATQPAREAVGGLVQPTTDAVTSFISGGQGSTWQPGAAVAASSASGLDVGVALALTGAYPSLIDSAADSTDRAGQQVAAEAPALVASAVLRRPVIVAPVDVVDEAAAPDEDAAVMPEPARVASEPAVVETPVDVPAQVGVLVVANRTAPVALAAPVAGPTETRRQTADRLNAENQAAIDAARAAQVRTKADADVANQTAINARQAATGATAGPQRVAVPSVPEAPSPAAGLPAGAPQARATADANNQAAIDAAKLAHAQSRTQANDANRTAIDSARLAKVPVTATLAATPAPVGLVTPTPPQPQPQSTPEPIATDPPTAPGPVFDMQAPPSDEADAPSDGD